MPNRSIWIVFRKELTDILRDSKTWIGAFLIPIVVIPFVVFIMNHSLSSVQQEARSYIPLVVQGDASSALVRKLQQAPGVEVVKSVDPLRDIKEGKVRVVISLPAQIERKLEAQANIPIRIWYDPTNQKSTLARGIVEKTLADYETEVVHERLRAAGISPKRLDPLSVSFASIATDERVAGSILSGIVPLMLMMALASGGIPVATDLIAGEKERGTLEALIAAPISAREVLSAKLLIVMMMSLISSLASGISMIIVLGMLPQESDTPAFLFLHPFALIVLLVTTILLSALFAGLELLLSTLARSFRAAQIYMTPLLILTMVPAYMMMPLHPVDIPAHYYLLPIFNGGAILKEVFYGEVDTTHVMMAVCSSLIYVGVVIGAAARLFRQERLLVK